MIKPLNEEIYYTIDRIQESIRNKKVLEFKYLEYTAQKELILKNHGFSYEVSAYTMIWSDDHYYMVGYSRKHKKIVTFRVDRMVQAALLDVVAIACPIDFNPSGYANEIFEMFDGTYTPVELKCSNDLMRVIIDRFGEDVDTSLLGSNHFKVTTQVYVSPRFYGWVFGFGEKMSILAPEEVKEQYRNMAKKVLD